MYRRIMFCVVMGWAMALIGTAAPASALVSPVVASIEHRAAALPAPNTRAQAERDQAALQPMVNQAVQAGSAAVVSALVNSGDPSVATDLLRDATLTEVTTDVSTTGAGVQTTYIRKLAPLKKGQHVVTRMRTRRFRAKAAGCWGSHSTQDVVGAVITFGWRQVAENGWCGNGSQITWNAGATYTSYAAGPYCFNDVEHNWSWDGSTAWIHGRNYGVLGGSYIWGCASLQVIQPVIRIAANGYWDRHNDF